jgi:hypothetical protein
VSINQAELATMQIALVINVAQLGAHLIQFIEKKKRNLIMKRNQEFGANEYT